MRFDNPITDHGFVFPDIANFPDVKNEPRFEGNAENDIEALKRAVGSGDLTIFNQITSKYLKDDSKLMSKIHYMFNFYSSFKHNRKPLKDVDLQGIIKPHTDLYERGISYGNIDTDKLKQMAEPHIDELLSQKDWRPPPGKFDRSKQLGDDFKNYIQNIFEQLGIIKCVSVYNQGGRMLKVANVVLHIATPTDQNWKQFLYDCETVTRTTNMHIDPKEDVIKSMIYLNDIGFDDGPFSYINGSHRWIYDDLQNIFGRAISTGSYCHTPESRASVFRLPSYLRVSHNFGRLLMDDDPLQQKLIDMEWTMITEITDKPRTHTSNVCVFDPAGIHRGGLCKKGTRIALQVLMK